MANFGAVCLIDLSYLVCLLEGSFSSTLPIKNTHLSFTYYHLINLFFFIASLVIRQCLRLTRRSWSWFD